MTTTRTVACSVCGVAVVKTYAGPKARRPVCSYACRWFLQYEGQSCVVPPMHPSRREPSKPKPLRVIPEWATRERECPICGAMFVQPHTPQVRYCSRRCANKAGRIARRVREAQSHGEYRWSDFMRVAAKFNYCCAYCGEKPERLDPDHVLPLSRGGSNTISNLLPCCLMCNSDKNDRTLAEWAIWRAARGKPKRVTQWSVSDQRYTHLATGVGYAPQAA